MRTLWERFRFHLRNLKRVRLGRNHYIQGGPVTTLTRNNKFLMLFLVFNFALFFYHVYQIIQTGEWFYYILASINLGAVLFIIYTIGYTKSVIRRSQQGPSRVIVRPIGSEHIKQLMKHRRDDDIVKRATTVKVIKDVQPEKDKSAFKDWQKENR